MKHSPGMLDHDDDIFSTAACALCRPQLLKLLEELNIENSPLVKALQIMEEEEPGSGERIVKMFGFDKDPTTS